MAFTDYLEIEYGTVFPASNLTDYPLLINIAGDSDIAAELAAGGGLKVTSGDGGTDYSFGLYPSSDPASGDLILRVKIPSLLTSASTGDPLCRIYVDSGETTVEDKAGVVSNGYVLFMPLDEDPSGSSPQMYDWVSESNVGTSEGSMTSGDLVAGQVANALDFDDTNDLIYGPLPATPFPSSAFTLEVLVKRKTQAAGVVLTACSSSDANDFASIQWGGVGAVNCTAVYKFRSLDSTALSFGAFAADVFRYVSFAVSGGTGYLQVNDGTPVSASLVPGFPDVNQFSVGGSKFGGTAANWANDIIDEARISAVDRSGDWRNWAYQNDFNNANTWQKGDFVTGGSLPGNITNGIVGGGIGSGAYYIG